jgi:predicted Zn-dependent protease
MFLIISCTSSPKPVTEASGLNTSEIPKIDMAAELAKLDTMLKVDTPNVTIAHESFLRALDMLEADRIIFAELFYKRALANDPESHFLLSELIKILLRQNKASEAFPLLKLAVQNPKATSDNFLYMARLYKENNNLDSAEIYYKKATDKMGDNYAILYEYAQLLEFLLKDPKLEKNELEIKRICRELKKIFDILLTELDYPPRLLEKQFFLYRMTNTSDSAFAVLLGEAFRANGIEYAEYGIWQAEILTSLKKYSEANEVLSTIFFMHSSKEVKSGVALKIANNYELADSVAIGIIWLEQLLAQEPEAHIAMNNLGYMLINHSIDVNRGITLIDKALTHSPEEPSYLDSKAWGLYKTGKYKEALEILEKLATNGMDDNELWEHLVAVCDALKLENKVKEYKAKIKK